MLFPSKNVSFPSLQLGRARHVTVTSPWSHAIRYQFRAWYGGGSVTYNPAVDFFFFCTTILEATRCYLTALWIVRTELRKGRRFSPSRREMEAFSDEDNDLTGSEKEVSTAYEEDFAK